MIHTGTTGIYALPVVLFTLIDAKKGRRLLALPKY